jgi:hypothetical protein
MQERPDIMSRLIRMATMLGKKVEDAVKAYKSHRRVFNENIN